MGLISALIVGVGTAAAVMFGVPAVVGLIGFGAVGIAAGSIAAGMMALGAGVTPAFVSVLQSIGAVGAIGLSTVVAFGLGAGLIALLV